MAAIHPGQQARATFRAAQGNRASGLGLLGVGGVAVEEHLEQVDAVVLVLFGGVIALGGEHVVEAGVGGEVGAGLADRFELAVELGGSFAVAVAEHPLIGVGAKLAHRRGARAVCSKPGRLGVEGVDLVGDAVVGVGDGLISDTCVDQCRGLGGCDVVLLAYSANDLVGTLYETSRARTHRARVVARCGQVEQVLEGGDAVDLPGRQPQGVCHVDQDIFGQMSEHVLCHVEDLDQLVLGMVGPVDLFVDNRESIIAGGMSGRAS